MTDPIGLPHFTRAPKKSRLPRGNFRGSRRLDIFTTLEIISGYIIRYNKYLLKRKRVIKCGGRESGAAK